MVLIRRKKISLNTLSSFAISGNHSATSMPRNMQSKIEAVNERRRHVYKPIREMNAQRIRCKNKLLKEAIPSHCNTCKVESRRKMPSTANNKLRFSFMLLKPNTIAYQNKTLAGCLSCVKNVQDTYIRALMKKAIACLLLGIGLVSFKPNQSVRIVFNSRRIFACR